MALQIKMPDKVDLNVSVLWGALMALVVGADWYVVRIYEREERKAALEEICETELSGDDEKDEAIIIARNALGGCSSL